MTKFILHGGSLSAKVESNLKFAQEVVSGLGDGAEILCAYFASDEGKWAELFENDQGRFSGAAPDRAFKFVLAQADREIFVGQVKSADALFFRGGNSEFIYEFMRQIDDFGELLDGKVVAGSSAGAYLLSRYFYTRSRDRIEKGLGTLPIKVLCHYTEAMDDKLQQLKAFGEDLEVYALREGKYVVIEV